jgi:DNA-binding IscR family transcriptional regulator
MANSRAAGAPIADRQRFGRLTEIERQRITDALMYARSEPARLRPWLNDAEAATLDMMRRLRAAHHDAAPSVSRLAEYLGWTRDAVVEQLEMLRHKGFIRRAADCSTYLETAEAVAFRCAVPLLLDLAETDPRDTAKSHDVHARHHANALDIARMIAQLVPQTQLVGNKRATNGLFHQPSIPQRSVRQIPPSVETGRKRPPIAA